MIAVLGSPYYAKKLVQTLLENNIEAVKITTSLKDRKLKSKLTSHKIIHYIGSPTVTIPGILSLIRFWLWKKKIFLRIYNICQVHQ